MMERDPWPRSALGPIAESRVDAHTPQLLPLSKTKLLRFSPPSFQLPQYLHNPSDTMSETPLFKDHSLIPCSPSLSLPGYRHQDGGTYMTQSAPG